jgi:hypothetical protein
VTHYQLPDGNLHETYLGDTSLETHASSDQNLHYHSLHSLHQLLWCFHPILLTSAVADSQLTVVFSEPLVGSGLLGLVLLAEMNYLLCIHHNWNDLG